MSLESFLKAQKERATWSGGQYSFFRLLLGIFVFKNTLALLLNPVVAGYEMDPTIYLILPLVLVAATLFALGWKDALASGFLLIFCVGDIFHFISPVSLFYWSGYLWVLFLFHLTLPRSPYGSWEARGRLDPSGSWFMPKVSQEVLWAIVASGSTLWQFARLSGHLDFLGLLFFALSCSLVVAFFYKPLRPWVWIASLVLCFFPIWFTAYPPGSFFVIIFLFDPKWFEDSTVDARQERIYYDGSCALCHASMRFVLAEDLREHFRFAPLQGPTYQQQVGETNPVPGSVEVLTFEEHRLKEAKAVLRILYQLGGLWRFLSMLLGCLPIFILDVLYRLVAKFRYQIFGKKEESCPRVPLELRARFDP